MPVETQVLSWSRCGGLSTIMTPESHDNHISLGRGDGRGVTRYRDYEKSYSRRLYSPMP